MFSNSLEERAEIVEIKRGYDKFSDHFAVLGIFKQWNKLYQARQPDEMFCIQNMLRGNTLRLVHSKFRLLVYCCFEWGN